jgi:hydrogenase expression/formation protein HypE
MRSEHTRILLAHGSGGRLTHELVETLFKPAFSNPALNVLDDAAVIAVPGHGSLAFTTDAFVVKPLFFPGGDIGRLSICGTVNDLAMKGAVAHSIAIAAIIEEGLEIGVLRSVVRSISSACCEAGVRIVTGDTKVVEKGKADGLFLTTSGVGSIAKGINVAGSRARPGDRILINGSVADHGMAVLTARNDFKLKSAIKSDCAPLNRLVGRIFEQSKEVHVLRDPTRGGVATTLNEIAAASNVGIIIDEALVPVRPDVRAACNILGIDPLYVANEGKLLCVLPEKVADKVLACMKKDRLGVDSRSIGEVVGSPRGVWLKTRAGGLRPLLMLEGEQLPRIC